MYYTYYLKSKKNGKKYIGSTDSLKRRYCEHNTGRGGEFTSRNGPWLLIFYECYIKREDAQEAEKFYKTGQGREFLRNKLKHYFDSQNNK